MPPAPVAVKVYVVETPGETLTEAELVTEPILDMLIEVALLTDHDNVALPPVQIKGVLELKDMLGTGYVQDPSLLVAFGL